MCLKRKIPLILFNKTSGIPFSININNNTKYVKRQSKIINIQTHNCDQSLEKSLNFIVYLIFLIDKIAKVRQYKLPNSLKL